MRVTSKMYLMDSTRNYLDFKLSQNYRVEIHFMPKIKHTKIKNIKREFKNWIFELINKLSILKHFIKYVLIETKIINTADVFQLFRFLTFMNWKGGNSS